MTFYNILWITIFALGGISLGLLGFIDLNYFTILLVNPSMFNRLIRRTEEAYLNVSASVFREATMQIRYQTQKF